MSPEHHETFACFGGTCSVHLSGTGPLGPAPQAIATVRRQLVAWHGRFSRFLPGSELSLLNADPAGTVAASPELLLLARATVDAGHASGGLVDATFADEVRRAGYAEHLAGPGVDLGRALSAAPPRRPAGPDPRRRWASVAVDRRAGTVTRPPGVHIDSGGLAKGLFADLLADRLSGYERFVVDCCGDLRLGGTRGARREVRIAHPVAGVAHVVERTAGATATSSIARRSWVGPDGLPAHHLLDPATGRPAWTGIVQVSAMAPTALEAERRSKAALLSGPAAASEHLPHGGVVVLDDLTVRVIDPRTPRRSLNGALRGGRLVLSGTA
ncbi:FAD:protein FMN transferase [Patulibacter sp.]|uniref:FAD:protein FMN transferase n=1 Tax=Patulibacter sp. TaxID=1912859 RepID=UPI00271DBC84|nr:FAD:protein FMN transferase [Patulibacter sp.]MDO9407532.1 FAD:protein FMN transferase [Patulibacter sp.]